jgi:calmodulin
MADTFALTSVDEAKAAPPPVTNQEEKELLRVYNRLAGYFRRSQNAEKRRECEGSMKLKRIAQDLKGYEDEGERLKVLVREQEMLTLSRPDQVSKFLISVDDVHEMLKTLKQKLKRTDVEEMVWEVDEDLDQCISWSEMKLMYTRNLMDKSGLEPNKIFNLTQFLIYDKNENDKVSVDETMNMLYARYGRSKMEMKLKELFGAGMTETGREGGEISYVQFINAIDKVQLQTFWGTTKGRIISLTTSGKKSLETLVATVGGYKKSKKGTKTHGR